MQKYGISEAERAARKELTDKQAASLETALGRLDPPVSFDDASKEWIFCDTSKSVERAGATKGHAPTLTASSRAVCARASGATSTRSSTDSCRAGKTTRSRHARARVLARGACLRLRLRVAHLALASALHESARAPVAPVGALGGLCRRLR